MTDPGFVADKVEAARVFCEALRPEPPMTVSEWADQFRVLSSKASAEPGKWRTARFPPHKEIMDCLSVYADVQEVAVMKGAQIGITEVALNTIGYAVDQSPGPVMYVMPTEQTAEKVSETRLQPMIDASASLAAKVGSGKSRDATNKKLFKDFPGGFLTLVGANAPGNLRSLPIRWLIGDEQDAYPISSGKEGDPYELAKVRCRTFARSKILTLSTPTEKETSRILQVFLQGDQRFYEVACLGCGTCAPIYWRNIKWERGNTDSARFICESCGHEHTEADKAGLLALGEWVPTAKAKRKGLRSYHLSALYSPWYSWAQAAQDWEDCIRPDGSVNQEKRQVFVNTVLGAPWEQTGEKVEADSLLDKREDFDTLLSDEIGLLTAGVDVQDDRLEIEVIGWGADEESWSIDYRVLMGDPSLPEVWSELDGYLKGRWPHAAFPLNGMPISATCIDTGGHNTQAVYDFVRDRQARKIWGIKGSRVFASPIWPRKASFSNKGRVPLYSVGVSSAKDVIFKRLPLIGHTGPGAMHFPKDRDKSYFDQLTAEEKRTKFVRGQRQFYWHPIRKRNEALDCRVYGLAALHGLLSTGLRLNQNCARIQGRAEATRASGATINMLGFAASPACGGGTARAGKGSPVAARPPQSKRPKRQTRSSYI